MICWRWLLVLLLGASGCGALDGAKYHRQIERALWELIP